MRLISLQINNFRPFYGESQKILFAHGDRNITVIHGCSGAGKTALLNAFTWTLFDSLSPGFLLPEDIVNRRAIREAKEGKTVEAWTKIEFEHKERRYIVKRTAYAQRVSGTPGYINQGPQNPTLQWSGPDGCCHNEELVFEAIGRILPQDLHTYFFFDGERIERIVQPRKKEKDEIGKATKKLLGLEIFHRAETHLNAVRRELEKELGSVGDAETARLIEQKQEAEKELEDIEDRQEEITRNIDAHNERIKEIEERLRQLREVEAIQRRRDQLNKEEDARRESLVIGRQNLASIISTSGYILFLQESIDKFNNLIESLRKRGELPTGIKMQFVDDLLNSELCICDRDLKPGSESRRAVENWKTKAGLSNVEEKAIRIGGEIIKILQSFPEIFERIDQIQQKRELDRKELSRIETELDDIAQQLKSSPREEIRELQSQLNQANDAIKTLHFEQGENSRSIRDLQEKIKDLADDIGRRKAIEERQNIAQRRVQAASDAAHLFTKIRSLMEVDFRKKLQHKIANLFRTISPTPYVPDLGEDYSLRLLDSSGESALPVAASQGENQILSLSFIGSVMDLAREYYAKQENLPAPDTSTYPLVMDSPFGSLDPIYRHQIAEHLPALADQVVVLVTKTQWRGEVEQSMAKRSGRSYVLTYYSPKEEAQTDYIEINGKTYELIKCSPNEHEFTEIIEVSHDR